MLTRRGADEDDVSSALARFRDARLNETVDLGRGVQAIPRHADGFRQALTGELMDDRLPLAVAYEFVAVLVGEQILDERLDGVRAALRSEGESDGFRVERGRSSRDGFEPVHIVSIRQATPSLIVDVRLFQWIWYAVHFPTIALGGNRIAYHLDLVSGAEDFFDLDDSLQENATK